MNTDIAPSDRVDMIKTMLNKLVDSTGVEKCNYVCAIDDFLNRLREDVVIMEQRIQDLEEKNQNSGDSETMST